ncbi:hypothetical protein GDO86_019005 [Hymenochirus boettgeri]|uniref:Uncharacterized protein n=1 Tax=Hymenochirus boettgeri TaxID=247094 RepID=A0A8T2ID15_9PIPI|nr:hypothetical protein GDO86_019005 [Hymenochirus boettgeri]
MKLIPQIIFNLGSPYPSVPKSYKGYIRRLAFLCIYLDGLLLTQSVLTFHCHFTVYMERFPCEVSNGVSIEMFTI